MSYEIQIGSVKLKGLESVTIESSISLLSDQCKITFPGMVYGRDLGIESKIKRGDPVLVRLGYDDNLRDEFKGYLRSIHPNSPMKLECEDAIYLFRKPIADKQFKKVSATALARYIVEQINKQLPENQKMKFITDVQAKGFEFEKFTIVNATGIQALEKLKSETGYAIYCRGRELHLHLLYTEKRGDVTYDFAKNVEQSDGLEYVKAEDKRVKIKVIGHSKKGAKVEAEAGEKGGDEVVIKLPTVANVASLAKRAQAELKKISYDGYKGAIRGWLVPHCQIGYSAKVIDQDYPNREGVYFVNGVKTEFSASGGVRTVSLGVRLSAGSTPGTTPRPVNPALPAALRKFITNGPRVDSPVGTPEGDPLEEDLGDEHSEPEGVWA